MTAIRVATVAALIAMLAVTGGCGSTATTSSTATQPTVGLPEILQRGSIRVCSTGDYRPFSYRDPQGNWSGLDIEMARDMAARLGVRLDLVPTTWANLIKRSGQQM